MNPGRRRLTAGLAAGFVVSGMPPAEYLVTVTDEKAIRDAYGRFGIRSSTRIAGDVFLVVFDADPGLATLEKLRAAHPAIRAVQPNQRYRATPQ